MGKRKHSIGNKNNYFDFSLPSTTENEINLQFGVTESAFFTKKFKQDTSSPSSRNCLQSALSGGSVSVAFVKITPWESHFAIYPPAALNER